MISISQISDYIKQKSVLITFNSGSWVVLTTIEQQIKEKIEKTGKPLKKWDVKINYGIKTGCNEAFIIDTEKRNELINKCPEAAEIIRPILKGKHIKKYSQYNQSDWIIIIPCGWTNKNRNGKEPEDFFKAFYPAIYNHLRTKSLIQSKGKGLFNRDDKGDYWWELRPCDYLPEFEKEKILYIDIMTDNEKEGYRFPSFSYAKNEVFTLNTAYFMVGDSSNLKYILGVLNSKVGKFIVKNNATQLQQRQYRLFQHFVEKFYIPIPNDFLKLKVIKYVESIVNNSENLENEIDEIVNKICEFDENEINFIMSQE